MGEAARYALLSMFNESRSSFLASIDQALQDLAGNAETQVALHPRRYGAGERTGGSCGLLDNSSAHQRRLGAGVGRSLFAAGDQRQRQGRNEKQSGEARPKHESPLCRWIGTFIVILVTKLVNSHK